jgi:WD40 repeat protein
MVASLAFSADRSRLASRDSHGVVKVWDMATYRERTSIQAYNSGGMGHALAFAPDGTLLATASVNDPSVRLWDAASGAPLGTLPGGALGVTAMAFSPHGKMLAIARPDGVVAVWDVIARGELGLLKSKGASLQTLAFAPDGRLLATSSTDGAVRLWDLTRLIQDIPPPGGSRRGAARANFSPRPGQPSGEPFSDPERTERGAPGVTARCDDPRTRVPALQASTPLGTVTIAAEPQKIACGAREFFASKRINY